MSSRKKSSRRLSSQNRARKNNSLQTILDYQELEARRVLTGYMPGELLIQFHPLESGIRHAVIGSLGASSIETIHTGPMKERGMGALERIRLNGTSVEDAMTQAAMIPGVRFAEPNYTGSFFGIANDTMYADGRLWGVYSDDLPDPIGPAGTTNQYGTQAEKVWLNVTTGSKDVYVAVLDTGVDYNHPDLNANMFDNPFDPADGVDNDGNGFIDDVRGWNFENDNNDPMDLQGHGTHIAGTIGAVGGNGLGVAGLNWETNIIAMRIGTAFPIASAAISSFDYITDLKTRHGINIVAANASWTVGNSQALFDAITRAAQADILTIVAAGNSANNNDANPTYPANYDTTDSAGYNSVITVAALASSGAMAGFSNYGANTVHIAAPGAGIWSTQPNNQYASFDGTSMAAPHVVGAVALYASVNPDASAAEIREALLDAAEPTPSLVGRVSTEGRLDLSNLVVAIGPDMSINNASVIEGNVGNRPIVFTVTIAESWPAIVSVNYATQNGTANAGEDFVATSGVLTFFPGETSKTITVQVIGDNFYEPNETFSVVLSRPVNARLTKAIGVGTIVNDDPRVVGESRILPLNSNWRTITFSRRYQDPIVILGTPSRYRNDPMTVRVQSVLPGSGSFRGSFQARVEEWNYLDGIHGMEHVPYMVFERGRHVLENGAVLVAGRSQVNHNFRDISFGASANFQEVPIVLAQVTTANEKSPVITRLHNVTKNGFSIRLQEEEGADGNHAFETVSWIAFEPGRFTAGGADLLAAVTPNVVTHNDYRINFDPQFLGTRPAFFAQPQTYHDSDPAVLRQRQLSYRSALIYLEEERSRDTELIRTAPERIGYVAFPAGVVIDNPLGMPSFQSMGLGSAAGGNQFAMTGAGSDEFFGLASYAFGNDLSVANTMSNHGLDDDLTNLNRIASGTDSTSATNQVVQSDFGNRASAFAEMFGDSSNDLSNGNDSAQELQELLGVI
jgi:thermitase